jgi:hypothetical protein
MRRLHPIGVTLVAVFAFGVVVASATATPTFLPAEWLINGKPITELTPIEIRIELLLLDTKTLLGESHITCSIILDGSIDLAVILRLPNY